ncbi:MAG: N-acetylmuramoyl-L-alanine amidase [Angelakisella sp.]|nr:N-acetylmuramoyl-L-alanine amidase [Angelakisella sp.]
MRGKKRIYFLTMGFALAAAVLFCGWLTDTLYIATMQTTAAVNRPKIVLDAGHGGMDGGATGNGITEKDINLSLTNKTKTLCTLFGFDVIMTREEDVSIHDESKKSIRLQKNSDLHNRLEIMQQPGLCAVVSIHLNKFQQSAVHGAQMFYSPHLPQSKELAQMLQDNIRAYIQNDNNRKIKKADSTLFLLYNNKINPAILAECGFLSNPGEASLLKTEEYQDKLAMAICYSLMKFQNREEGIIGGSEQGQK